MKLKNLFFTLLVLVGIAAVPAMAQENSEPVATSSEPLVLTLQQALEIALSENPTVQIADKTIETKKYAKKGTYASLWPEISASATYQRYIKKQTFHIIGRYCQQLFGRCFCCYACCECPVVEVVEALVNGCRAGR